MREEKIYVVNFIFWLFWNFVVSYLLHNITPPLKFHRSVFHVFNINVFVKVRYVWSLIDIYNSVCHYMSRMCRTCCDVLRCDRIWVFWVIVLSTSAIWLQTAESGITMLASSLTFAQSSLTAYAHHLIYSSFTSTFIATFTLHSFPQSLVH